VAEIVKRIFVELKDEVAEKGDWEARGKAQDARGWTSYCFFLAGRSRDEVDRAIKAKINRTFVQVVPSANPEGVWVRGARYELEAAMAVIEAAA
jgi:hypothetical protein